MIRAFALPMVLSACAGDKDSIDSQIGSRDDSSVRDSGQANQHDHSVRITVEGSGEGRLVGARHMQPGDLGDVWAQELVEDGEAFLVLNTPNAAVLADDGFGVGHAMFLLVLRQDENENGFVDNDEPIHGIAETQLLYLDDEPSSNSQFAGYGSGWNAWIPSESGANRAGQEELISIEIVASLAPVDNLILSGTSDVPSKPADPIRVTAFPLETKPVDGEWTGLIFDEVLTSQWSLTISGNPDSTHVNQTSDRGPSAMEFPVVYIDVDESGSLHLETDEILHHVCFDEGPIMLQWLAEIRDLSVALSSLDVRPTIGWSVVVSSSTQWLDAEQMTQLSADSSCLMEGT